MDIKKILKNILLALFIIGGVAILIKTSLESDFAKINTKSYTADTQSGIKMKNEYSKKLYYSTKFERDSINDNLLSLGDFVVNINDDKKTTKLIMKVSIETNEDTIDDIMKSQSVIRNDVINSVRDLKSPIITQELLSQEIKKNLNSRFDKSSIKNVYFQKFIIQ